MLHCLRVGITFFAAALHARAERPPVSRLYTCPRFSGQSIQTIKRKSRRNHRIYFRCIAILILWENFTDFTWKKYGGIRGGHDHSSRGFRALFFTPLSSVTPADGRFGTALIQPLMGVNSCKICTTAWHARPVQHETGCKVLRLDHMPPRPELRRAASESRPFLAELDCDCARRGAYSIVLATNTVR